jgi:hypothetical protein
MSARDTFHEIVKNALEKDGWLITHDPYPMQAGSLDLAIDLGAEKVIAAEREGRKVAIEIKSFLGPSRISQFYGALGQFITYRAALQLQEKERILYLAISSEVYESFFVATFMQKLIEENHLYLLTYDIDQEVIGKWIP